MTPTARIISLSLMRRPPPIPRLNKRQELVRVSSLKLLELGDNNFALSVLEDLKAVPVVEQVLAATSVQLEEAYRDDGVLRPAPLGFL